VKRKELLTIAVAGLIAAGCVVKANPAFAGHEGHEAAGHKDSCKGKKDSCKGEKESCKGKKDSCKGKSGCKGE
jgi:hypothetical protein